MRKSNPLQDRIRKYFEKIKLAEEGPARMSCCFIFEVVSSSHLIIERTTAVDKEAASRFIKHAISQAHLKNKPSVSASEVGPSQVAPIPAKVTSKMLARAEYEQELKELDEQEGSDEGGLEVFGENAEEEEESASGQATMSPPPVPKLTTEDRPGNRKRHRANVDPFAGMSRHIIFSLHSLNSRTGYGDDDSEAPADITGQNASNIEERRYRSAGPSPTPSRNLAMGAALLATPNPTWNNSPMRSMSPTMGNKSKKAKALASDSGSISSLDRSAGTTVQKGAKKEKKGRRKSGIS